MENPYFSLHKEFRDAGAEVLISSGQACVAFGIAAFSKDGDWIVRENGCACDAVLAVLESHHAVYRLGVPLHPDWLCRGLTSHFEFRTVDGFRMRTDFCSRPPRVSDVDVMWTCAVKAGDVDVVDVESLIRMKQTRRLRDYSVIGALAEVAGLEGGVPELALYHLQDYECLLQAVQRWPTEANACRRDAVRLLCEKASRATVVAAVAVEQDERMQQDQERIATIQSEYGDYVRVFGRLRSEWRRAGAALTDQHRELMTHARALRRGTS